MKNLKNEILQLTDGGLDVFKHYLDPNRRRGKMLFNPFYADTNPSVSIFRCKYTDKYMFHDHGNPQYSGDCFWFVAMHYNLDVKRDFRQTLAKIVADLGLPICNVPSREEWKTANPKTTYALPARKPTLKKKKIYGYKQKQFSDAELLFWGKYGIGLETLKRYNVVSLGSFTGVSNDGHQYTIYSNPESPLFGYLVRENHIKIYHPKDKVRFLHGGEMPSPYCFGFKQLPRQGNVVFVTGGEKDVLSLAAHGHYAVCFNSENSEVSESIIDNLCERFTHVIFMYDVDETGIKRMSEIGKQFSDTKAIMFPLPLEGTKSEKDISDYFAAGNTIEDFDNMLNDVLDELDPEGLELMNSCEGDFNNPPKTTMPVITAGGVPIASYGNLVFIGGASGSGKSNFATSLLSGAFITEDLEKPIDTLGYSITPNYERRAVLHFDTEQSEEELYNNAHMAVSRAELLHKPDFYHYYSTAAMDLTQRLRVICAAMEYHYRRNKGIHLVLIDGIADLIPTANDELRGNEIIDKIYHMAIKFNTCIMCVLHLVPNGLKLRGHIGSQGERKAAAVIIVEKKDGEDTVVIKANKVRGGNPLEVPMFKIAWNKIKKMFVSIGACSKEETKNRNYEDLKDTAIELYQDKAAYTHNELRDKLAELLQCPEYKAKNMIAYMAKQGILIKVEKEYRLNKSLLKT